MTLCFSTDLFLATFLSPIHSRKYHERYEYIWPMCQNFESMAKDDQDPSLQLTVVTGAGRVSVSRRLLQLLSPLVREAVSGLPVLATLQPLTIILPDTDAVTVTTMMELVLTGQTNVDTIGVLLNESWSLF